MTAFKKVFLSLSLFSQIRLKLEKRFPFILDGDVTKDLLTSLIYIGPY